MESNDEFKEIYIKNCTCYYFDDIIKFKDFYLNNILIGEKSYKNISVYGISYKSLVGAKALCIRFNEIDGFIRAYDGTRCLVLFGAERYDFLYNRIRYLIGLKNDITCVISYVTYNYARIKVDSFGSLPLEKL